MTPEWKDRIRLRVKYLESILPRFREEKDNCLMVAAAELHRLREAVAR